MQKQDEADKEGGEEKRREEKRREEKRREQGAECHLRKIASVKSKSTLAPTAAWTVQHVWKLYYIPGPHKIQRRCLV